MKNIVQQTVPFVQSVNPHLTLCREQTKPLALIPAGQQAQSFSRYLQSHQIYTSLFVDNNPQKQGCVILDQKVISLPAYTKIADRYHLLISTNETIAAQLVEQLLSKGISSENFTVIDSDYLCLTPSEIDSASDFIQANIREYEQAYQLFTDSLSQTTFLNLLNYRMTFDTSLLKAVRRPIEFQYFEPEIYAISSDDSFVDCGAFTGDTLEQTMGLVGNRISAYYSFEPDHHNFTELTTMASKYSNIHLFNYGVSKEKGMLNFEQSSSSYSRLGSSEGCSIEVVSLDELLIDSTVSMIKMDIEGAEYDALLGAKKLICAQKPVLAISVYHKLEDLFRLPLLINSLGVSYRYYLRHYTNQAIETVLYAVYTPDVEQK